MGLYSEEGTAHRNGVEFIRSLIHVVCARGQDMEEQVSVRMAEEGGNMFQRIVATSTG